MHHFFGNCTIDDNLRPMVNSWPIFPIHILKLVNAWQFYGFVMTSDVADDSGFCSILSYGKIQEDTKILNLVHIRIQFKMAKE